MCSDLIKAAVLTAVLVLVTCCTTVRKITKIGRSGTTVEISIPSDPDPQEEAVPEYDIDKGGEDPVHDDGEPFIMNAIKDTETGEMVATDVISASRVVARFRNVAERNGKVQVEFDITVPAAMISSDWKLKFMPEMDLCGNVTALDPIYITGAKYREAQLRGYQRYRAFLASIITDTTKFIHIGQLELFLQRHYPEIYAMKNDSTLISDPQAENIFGVTQKQALEHYTRTMLMTRNERKKMNKDRMFRKYVKDPLESEGIRLDTVITSAEGDVSYRYVQPVRSFPGLRKIIISLGGEILREGEAVYTMQHPDDLVYYVSTLSSLADSSPKYRTKVISRTVYDNTRAFIDFGMDSAVIDTTLEGNASEFARIRRCIADITSNEEFILDSMSVIASCSPEGRYDYNADLARRRSEAILDYIRTDFPDSLSGRLRSVSVPENWEQFRLIVKSDSVICARTKEMLIAAMDKKDKDSVEMSFRDLPEYKYMREKIYPRLRSVKFNFWLHRRDMIKDTVHTLELDTLYMRGVEAIRNMEYALAVDILRPYKDCNSALAYLSSGYDDSAVAVLSGIKNRDWRSNYLMAVALARLGKKEEAVRYFRESASVEPSMVHRANLDPEISELVKNMNL